MLQTLFLFKGGIRTHSLDISTHSPSLMHVRVAYSWRPQAAAVDICEGASPGLRPPAPHMLCFPYTHTPTVRLGLHIGHRPCSHSRGWSENSEGQRSENTASEAPGRQSDYCPVPHSPCLG